MTLNALLGIRQKAKPGTEKETMLRALVYNLVMMRFQDHATQIRTISEVQTVGMQVGITGDEIDRMMDKYQFWDPYGTPTPAVRRLWDTMLKCGEMDEQLGSDAGMLQFHAINYLMDAFIFGGEILTVEEADRRRNEYMTRG